MALPYILAASFTIFAQLPAEAPVPELRIYGYTIEQLAQIGVGVSTAILTIVTTFETCWKRLNKTVREETERATTVNTEKIDGVKNDLESISAAQSEAQTLLYTEVQRLRVDLESTNASLANNLNKNTELTQLLANLVLDLKASGCRFVPKPEPEPTAIKPVTTFVSPTPHS